MVLIKQHLNELYIERFKYKDFRRIEAFHHSLKSFDEKRARELATQSERIAAMAPVLADLMSSKDPLIELRLKTLETSFNTLSETQASNLKQIANVATGSDAITLTTSNDNKKDPDPLKNKNTRKGYAPCSYCNRPGHFWRICRVKQTDDENQRRKTQNMINVDLKIIDLLAATSQAARTTKSQLYVIAGQNARANPLKPSGRK